jgi:ribonucleoside-diphosphate reductase alpha chain
MAKEGSTVSGLMDSFATAVSLALQHGVPLKVLCEKFAHTRFEPSGWTGNPEIGFAKSIMDYIFRWIQLRFLSGTQLDLFAGLTPQTHIPIQGHITSPANTVVASPDVSSRSEAKGSASSTSPSYAPATQTVTPQKTVILSEAEGPASRTSPDPTDTDRSAPQGGIAPDLQARSGLNSSSRSEAEGPASSFMEGSALSMEDRGIYHASDAMKDLYDMGDSPSCATCGAIMTRSGSCYRCMSCGSTSGCS